MSRFYFFFSFLTHGCSAVASFVSLCDHSFFAHSNCVNFNQDALRAVSKPGNILSCAQAIQVSVHFVCVRFKYKLLLSPFPIVSVAVWITVFALFYHCLYLFQSITKPCCTRAKLYPLLFVAFTSGE